MMELLKKLAESNTINFIIMLGILAVIVIKMNFKASMDTSISNVAQLPVAGGVVLIIISMFLTFIAGLIPAKLAAKKDPVVALRSE